MLLDNFKLFRDIAQNKSISRGASTNEISQSAASQYIQETERRLGVTLLDRTTRPLALTPPASCSTTFAAMRCGAKSSSRYNWKTSKG